jgi:hypothetical protein
MAVICGWHCRLACIVHHTIVALELTMLSTSCMLLRSPSTSNCHGCLGLALRWSTLTNATMAPARCIKQVSAGAYAHSYTRGPHKQTFACFLDNRTATKLFVSSC